MLDDPNSTPDYSLPAVVAGNAEQDSLPFRRWLMGHFVPEALGLRHSAEVEVKWGRYPRGFGESEWTACRTATTLALLVSGTHQITLPDRVVTLSRPGDYLIWGPNIPHHWRALDENLLVTIRWPSVPDDSYEVPKEMLKRMKS